MRILLDTHALIWVLSDHADLSPAAAESFLSEGADVFASVVNLWEMAIKLNVGKLRLPTSLERIAGELLPSLGVRLLPLAPAHLFRLRDLPRHHGDPFDRTLLAQALEEDLAVMSRDAAFDAYGVERIW